MDTPMIGQIWRNKRSRKHYRVQLIANEEATRKGYPVIICYSEVEGGPVWAKKIKPWLYTMEPVAPTVGTIEGEVIDG